CSDLTDETAGTGADGLEGVDDRDVAAVVFTGHDRAGVDEDRREVQAGRGHEHAGQALVTPGEQDGAVQPLGFDDGLDRVGDDLPGDEGEVHADVTHRDAVGHRDGAELQRVPAGSMYAVL